MSKPRVTLVTSSEFPNLEPDDQGLVQALADRGIDVAIAVWNDPGVNWEKAGMVVLRCASDYADDREAFLDWASSVPRLLNHADAIIWNTDKHYLNELAALGVPTIDTIWLEPEANLIKPQVHSRFPALDDFVVKPAVSSGGKYAGRFSAIDPRSRGKAITHTMSMLRDGRSVMVQRYMEEVAKYGELSLVYMNGLIAYAIDKRTELHDANDAEFGISEEIIAVREPTAQEWRWGEQIRTAIHTMVKKRLGRDEQFLFGRYDITRDGKGGFWLMEASLTETHLYLGGDSKRIGDFADAIALRAFW